MSSINHEHDDDALHELLLRSGALERHEPTSDLVAATMRRLPHAPPRVVARRAAIRQVLSRSVTLLAVALLLVPATIGALNLILGTETPMGALAGAAGQANMRAAILAATGQRFDASLIRGLVAILVWLAQMAAVVLAIGFWSHRSAAAGMTLLAAPLRALGTGLMAISALGVVVAMLLTLLTATVIGLPIAAGVALLVHVPIALGIAVGARALGLRLSGHHPHHDFDRNLIASASALALPAALASLFSIPAVFLTLYLLAIPGIGALVLSQGGMRPVVGSKSGVRG
jgi:hypothetical protein